MQTTVTVAGVTFVWNPERLAELLGTSRSVDDRTRGRAGRRFREPGERRAADADRFYRPHGRERQTRDAASSRVSALPRRSSVGLLLTSNSVPTLPLYEHHTVAVANYIVLSE